MIKIVCMALFMVFLLAGCKENSQENDLSQIKLPDAPLIIEEKRTLAKDEEACEKGEARACFLLGIMWESNLIEKRDSKKAHLYFQKACNLGYAKSCYNLALLYEEGGAIKKDLSQARRYYKMACDKEHPIACNNLGILWMTGEGGPESKSNASRYLQKSCNLGHTEACSLVKN